MHITDSEEGLVAYAFVQDVAASWEQYGRVAAALVEPAPVGLLLHVAGPTDEGFRTIDIWESEEAWGRFQAERLAPAIAALGGPARPEPTFRDVQARHIVFGEAITAQVCRQKERSRRDIRRRSTPGQGSREMENQDP
ncbi:MAG: hypothetical protein E6F94_13995 [Actinobacteria bacterium]|nr:MAG: hypothetical protein E6F94_13995 [Actinomycetota bacterium]